MAFKMKGSHHYGKNPLKHTKNDDGSDPGNHAHDERAVRGLYDHYITTEGKKGKTMKGNETGGGHSSTEGSWDMLGGSDNIHYTHPDSKNYKEEESPAKQKVDPDAPGTPGKPGYEPPVKREDLDAEGKAIWDALRVKKERKHQKLPTYKEAWTNMSDEDKAKHGSYKEFEKSAKDYNKGKEEKKAFEEYFSTRFGDPIKKDNSRPQGVDPEWENADEVD